MIGYAIDQDPAPALVVMPTLELARSVSATRIQPMIENSPTLRAKMPKDRDDFSLQEMIFPGMVLALAGANSPASLASRPARYLIGDEIDKFPQFSGKEADPISLATERQKTFWNRKTFLASTPTLETGKITKALEQCDEIRDFHLPCPHCGALAPLTFQNIKWPDSIDKSSPDYARQVGSTAWYECESCRGRIDDLHRAPMIAAGVWVPRKKFNGIVRSVGFQLSSLYSPWLRWGDIAEKFINSKPFPETLQNFVNSWLAEPWVERVQENKEEDLSAVRCDLPRATVPEEAVVLTAGIDMQQDGFWFGVRAWAPDATSWLIDCGYLPTWQELEELLFSTAYKAASGREHRIWRALIDSGGTRADGAAVSRTEEVYHWVRRNGTGRGCRVFCCKGSSKTLQGNVILGSPIDRTPSGKPMPGGIQIVSIDTDRVKDALWYALDQARDHAPQAAYVNAETPDSWFKHLTAEEKRRNRDGTTEWVQIRRENHLLDVEVYLRASVDWGLLGGLRPFQAARPRPEAQQAQAQKTPATPNPYTTGHANSGNPYTRR